MSVDIAVIDYKAGNLTSVMKALNWLGAKAFVTADPDAVRRATKIILPGVGHFAATSLLDAASITAAVRDSIRRGVPFLGICVGLQWLFAGSTEAPNVQGLGHFEGVCERFPVGAKVPHVGWNSIDVNSESRLPKSRLMDAVKDGEFVYYSHSYKAPLVNATVAVTDYGDRFSGAVERENVMGVQFHPEKSGPTGMRVLRNFVNL